MTPLSGKEHALLQEKDKRIDLRAELDGLDIQIKDLKVQYEQYFSGILPLPPDKLHAEVKRLVRKLRKAPFKSSAMLYRLRNLETKYQTFNSYWQRVLRQKEEGTYSRDLFKANLRERLAQETAKEESNEGLAEKGLQGLFQAYRSAVEKHTGKKIEVKFDAFKDSLVKRAQEFKQRHGNKKLSFKVVVKDGKVTVQARVKD